MILWLVSSQLRQIACIKRFADINLANERMEEVMNEIFEWNGSVGLYHEYKGTETQCSNPRCKKKFQDGDIVTKTSCDDKIVCRHKCEVWYAELVGKTNWELSPYVFFTKNIFKF